MKKRFAIVAMLLSLVLVLAACGGSGESTTSEGTSGDAGAKKTVALLIAYRGDMSFNDSAASGIDNVIKNMSDKVDAKIIEYGEDVDKYEASVVDAAEAGYDMIIVGSVLQEYVELHADDYPDTTFVMFDGEVDWSKGDFANVYCIVYKANEASYLGGYVASKLSKTGVIGFLGGTEQPIISDFLVGYVEGAQEANPDIKIASSYVGGWSDPAKGKDLSIAMFNQGADVVFGVAGGSGNGLFEAAIENNKLAIGVDSDQAMLFKSQGDEATAKIMPTSVLKNVGASIERAVDLFVKGELKIGEAETLGLAENGVGLADNEYYQSLVPQEVRDEVKAIEEKIISGEIQVGTGYGKSTEEINQLRQQIAP